jgi:hypothetical protein
MVTRRGGERGPIPCCERDARAARPHRCINRRYLFIVTLSRSEGSIALGTEMLRFAQHDNEEVSSVDAYCVPILVMLSKAKGPARGAPGCFALLSMTSGAVRMTRGKLLVLPLE